MICYLRLENLQVILWLNLNMIGRTASTTPWGLDDNFEPVKLTPIDCAPFDPDINIIPVKFFKANGTL